MSTGSNECCNLSNFLDQPGADMKEMLEKEFSFEGLVRFYQILRMTLTRIIFISNIKLDHILIIFSGLESSCFCGLGLSC